MGNLKRICPSETNSASKRQQNTSPHCDATTDDGVIEDSTEIGICTCIQVHVEISSMFTAADSSIFHADANSVTTQLIDEASTIVSPSVSVSYYDLCVCMVPSIVFFR